MMFDPDKQARPPQTIPISADAFSMQQDTSVYWLGSAGVLVNCRGTILLIDPALEYEERDDSIFSEAGALKLLWKTPVRANDIPHVDAVLLTHSDPDHMGPDTMRILAEKGAVFHCPVHTRQVLLNLGIPISQLEPHRACEIFDIGPVTVTMTRASHAWQLLETGFDYYYGEDDCCGFELETPDGILWDPGDTRLLEEHLSRRKADLLFIDFCEDPGHLNTKNAIRLANSQPDADLIPFHWGTFSEDRGCYTADPESVRPNLTNSDRLHVLSFGEKYTLHRKDTTS